MHSFFPSKLQSAVVKADGPTIGQEVGQKNLTLKSAVVKADGPTIGQEVGLKNMTLGLVERSASSRVKMSSNPDTVKVVNAKVDESAVDNAKDKAKADGSVVDNVEDKAKVGESAAVDNAKDKAKVDGSVVDNVKDAAKVDESTVDNAKDAAKVDSDEVKVDEDAKAIVKDVLADIIAKVDNAKADAKATNATEVTMGEFLKKAQRDAASKKTKKR